MYTDELIRTLQYFVDLADEEIQPAEDNDYFDDPDIEERIKGVRDAIVEAQKLIQVAGK